MKYTTQTWVMAILLMLSFAAISTGSMASIPNNKNFLEQWTAAKTILSVPQNREAVGIVQQEEALSPRFLTESQRRPIALTEQNIECLATNMYHEARGEGEIGMLAVAYVTINRVNHKRFPNTICGVVKQALYDDEGQLILNKCQFSWYCDGIPDTIRNKKVYEQAKALAAQAIEGTIYNPIDNSLFFHNTSVNPKWSNVFRVVAEIGGHIFYEDHIGRA